jgi:adenylate cyclase class 2
MRAAVIDSEVRVAVAEHRNIASANFNDPRCPFSNLALPGNRYQHVWLLALLSYSSSMAALEIELKFPAPADVFERIAAVQCVLQGSHLEQDHYYNAPDRDFAKTNEAFRIRVIDGKCAFTYKGPRQAGPAKTRREIELPIAGDLAVANSLVESLGYRPTAIVEKRRTVWTFSRGGFDLTISLDELAAIGTFVEVEIVTEEAMKTEAESVLMSVCKELKLQQPEPRSYLRMILETTPSRT